MRRVALMAALVAVGCYPAERSPGDSSRVDTDAERDAQRVSRDAFEKWNEANKRLDAETSWRGMTRSLRQTWLWGRLRDNTDQDTQLHLKRLDAEERKILDKWYEAHEKWQPQRAEMLPESILNGRWLFNLYRQTMERARGDIQTQAEARRVLEVYVGLDGGVTILTDTLGVRELYDMMFEGDGWKVNLCKPAPHKKS